MRWTLKLGAVFAMATILGMAGCGSEDSNLTWVSSVSSGHSHSVSIMEGDLGGGEPIVATTSSTGGHTHTVELTAGESATIYDGGVVTKTTSVNGGHSHTFVFDRSTVDQGSSRGY